jgi:hypothetical protein
MIDLSNTDLTLIHLALIRLSECPAGEEEQKLVDDLLKRVIGECTKPNARAGGRLQTFRHRRPRRQPEGTATATPVYREARAR